MTRTLAEAIDLVDPFCNPEHMRANITRPFLGNAGRVVATDGHTMGVAAFEGAGDDMRLLDTRHGPPPPWMHLPPAAPRCVGEIALPECLRHYPARWSVAVTIHPGGSARLNAWIPARTGKHGKVLSPEVRMVKDQALDGFEQTNVRESLSVDAAYLVRAFDFASLGYMCAVALYVDGPLDALVLCPTSTATTRANLLEADRFALVMPMRM